MKKQMKLESLAKISDMDDKNLGQFLGGGAMCGVSKLIKTVQLAAKQKEGKAILACDNRDKVVIYI